MTEILAPTFGQGRRLAKYHVCPPNPPALVVKLIM